MNSRATKRLLPIAIVGAATLAVFFSPSESEIEPGPESPAGVTEAVQTPTSTVREAEPTALALPPGAAALPQRPVAELGVEETNAAADEPNPEEGLVGRPTATTNREAARPTTADSTDPGFPPQRDLMADADVVQAMYFSLPGLGECHRMLRELEPATPLELTFVFDLVVERDRESEFGIPSLQSVSADDLTLDDVACFADVLQELRVPQPDGERYSTSLQVTLRTDEG